MSAQTQAELEKKHGTPQAFAKAIWTAYNAGFINHFEAVRGIRDYWREWTDAGLLLDPQDCIASGTRFCEVGCVHGKDKGECEQ